MDGRERDGYSRYDDRPPRLRSSSSDIGRRGPTSGFDRFDDDLRLSDDPPTWQDRFGSTRQRGANEDSSERPASSQAPAARRTETRYGDSPSRDDDRYGSNPDRPRQRGPRAYDDVLDERSSDRVADPHDRLRRVSERRARPIDDREPRRERNPSDDDAYREPATRPATIRSSRQSGSTGRTARPSLPSPQFRALGSLLARSSADAGALTRLGAISMASVLALSILTMARVGAMGDWLVMRLDAAGEPRVWATNEALWRVPLLVAFATMAGLILAWRLRRHDAFAAQFTLLAVLLLHGFGWVAAGRLLF